MRRFLVCITLLGFVSPAVACLNDKELLTHEQEFRSQYKEQKSPPPPASSEPAVSPGNPVLFGGGAVLLVGAFALTFMGRRVRN